MAGVKLSQTAVQQIRDTIQRVNDLPSTKGIAVPGKGWSENSNPPAFPFTVFSWLEDEETDTWFFRVCCGKEWADEGMNSTVATSEKAGRVRTQVAGYAVSFLEVDADDFDQVQGGFISVKIRIPDAYTGITAVLYQSIAAPANLVGVQTGYTDVFIQLAFVAEDGEVTQYHWGDIDLPILGTGGGMTPVKITSGSGTDHVGSVYANGVDAMATETGVTIKVLQIATGAVIPVNTLLWATKLKWAGTKQWTVDVARWY